MSNVDLTESEPQRKFNPTPQQAAVIDFANHGSGSGIVTAVAGAGKTTTLVEAVRVLTGTTAVLCFNKSIADELKARMPVRDGLNIGTSHSFGFAALRDALGSGIKVEQYKVSNHAERSVGLERWEKGSVCELVSLVKQFAIGCDGGMPDTDATYWEVAQRFNVEFPEGKNAQHYITKARELLNVCRKDKREIDFDDMLYMVLALDINVRQYDNVLVDEAQDLNVAQRILIRRMVKEGGRLIAVGDPRQAIYGFRGADSDSFRLIKEEFNAVDLPLTVTFRCPKLVVEEAQRYVSHITAHETAPQGEVKTLLTPAEIEDEAKPGDVILCRFNRPIISLAFKFIRKGVPAKIAGRSIGMQLVKLVDRWKTVKTFEGLRTKLEAYLVAELKKAQAAKSQAMAEKVVDMVGTLFDMMDALSDAKGANMSRVDELKDWITSNYSDKIDGARFITLSTIHKSKGLEWPRVFFYGSEETSPFAQQDWEFEQEANLKYVALTRAQKQLFLIPRLPRRGEGDIQSKVDELMARVNIQSDDANVSVSEND